MLLAPPTGVTGAALSGLLKLRDEVKLGAQVREFPLFYLVQVGVGAVFGLFVDLFFATGWLTFTLQLSRYWCRCLRRGLF